MSKSSAGAAKPSQQKNLGMFDRRLATGLTRLSLSAAALALAMVGTALIGVNYWMERDALAQQMRAQAQVLAANAASAVVFDDRQFGRELLASLGNSPWVDHASLLTQEGKVFAEYRRPGLRAHHHSDGARDHHHDVSFTAEMLAIRQPVYMDQKQVGSIYLEISLDLLFKRLYAFMLVTVLLIAVALLLTYLLGKGVRRRLARMEDKLYELAYIDPVTGLFNRHAASKHLQEYARHARRNGSGFSVVTLDLDDFKTINDTLGHHVGDQVLRIIADRIRAVLQLGARAYRFGGDEFVVICPCGNGLNDPHSYGLMVSHALGGNIQLQGMDIRLSGSAGVARFPEDGRRPVEVLRASDMAMYSAKAKGKNGLVVFSPALRQASEERVALESDLRQALSSNQLVLFYQPIIGMQQGEVVCVEALVRWNHPVRGLLNPAAFIEVAEDSGLVVELGGWALAEAARQMARWDAQGLPPVHVAVNVSARQLAAGVLVTQYREAIATTGCDPGRLEIELTEHSLVENLQQSLAMLNELRSMGVSIAIDDFGTGLSSLSYLKRLPINKLKIDRSFVRDLPEDQGDVAIVGAALSMARALNLEVVAEGIETQTQFRALQRMGCSLAQGYLFCRPCEPDALVAWWQVHLQSLDDFQQPAKSPTISMKQWLMNR